MDDGVLILAQDDRLRVLAGEDVSLALGLFLLGEGALPNRH